MVKRVVLAVLGAALLANALAVTLVSGHNIGFDIEGFIGLVFLVYAVLWKRLLKLRVFTSAVAACFALTAAACVFLFVYGSIDNADYSEDAVIVLGAGLSGDRVTTILAYRLDKAADYYSRNDSVSVFTSGGQGPGETVPEALAMKRYLTDLGVAVAGIEDGSTSTYENLYETARRYFDFEQGRIAEPIVVVTNNFHVFRSVMVARNVGFADVRHVGAPTQLHYLIPYLLREIPAVAAEVFYSATGGR